MDPFVLRHVSETQTENGDGHTGDSVIYSNMTVATFDTNKGFCGLGLCFYITHKNIISLLFLL